MRDITLDYIAGFTDGEGYLGIKRHTHKLCKKGYRYVAVIKIAQREKDAYVLYKIKERYGGHISKPRMGGNRQPTVMWELSNNKLMKKFIEDMEDKLIIKQPQLKILQNFLEIGNIKTRKPDKIEAEREKVYKAREELYKQVLIINRRGLAETK